MKQKSSLNKVFHFLPLKTDKWVFALRLFLCHLYLLWGLNKRFRATCRSTRLFNKHASQGRVLHTSGHSMAHVHVPLCNAWWEPAVCSHHTAHPCPMPEYRSCWQLLHEQLGLRCPLVLPGDLVRKIIYKEIMIIISCLIYLWDVSSLNVHRAI